ncbi:MAG: hypothetical protein WCE21_02375 [Candidatus Babeliales bacterium]
MKKLLLSIAAACVTTATMHGMNTTHSIVFDITEKLFASSSIEEPILDPNEVLADKNAHRSLYEFVMNDITSHKSIVCDLKKHKNAFRPLLDTINFFEADELINTNDSRAQCVALDTERDNALKKLALQAYASRILTHMLQKRLTIPVESSN